jgi:macrolide-specific efflux system membrane fusion protein
LDDPTAYQVDVSIPEADAVNVKVGQLASVTVDALTGTTLDGAVTSIASTSTVTSNVVTYAAVIGVAQPPATVKAGMSASVTITTVSKNNVLVVPTAAITTQGGTTYVQKLVNGQPVQTEVSVGIQGDSESEITSGLAAGDQVTITITTVTAASGAGGATGTGTLTGGGGFGGGGGFTGGGRGGPGGAVN